MLKLVVTLLVALLAGAVVSDTTPTIGTTNITSINNNGFDVILLDTPAWVHSIERNYYNRTAEEFFVYGGRTLRKVHAGMNTADFYAESVEFYPNQLYMIDLHSYVIVVNGTAYQFSVGIADNDAYDNPVLDGKAVGPYFPLVITRQPLNGTNVGTDPWQFVQPALSKGLDPVDFTGFMMSAIRCDDWSYRVNNTIMAYFAGFQIINASVSAFTFLRTGFPSAPGTGILQSSYFDYDVDTDVVQLYQNKATTFSATYKPWIHLVFGVGPNLNSILAVVVDPNTQVIYAIDVTSQATIGIASTFPFTTDPLNPRELVSVDYDFFAKVLVVGFSRSGFQNGYVAVFNFSANPTSLQIPDPTTMIELPANYSNPKALAVDAREGYVYIGFNGYNEVLKVNLQTGAVAGYQRLPEYLHRSWEATVTHGHVYFVSNEQNSKIYRVDKQDFCPTACPYFGYCQKGQCVCGEYFSLNHDKTQCVLTAQAGEIRYIHKYHTAHGGEIALGILFALTFIGGALGWFMWYRGRRGAYQAV